MVRFQLDPPVRFYRCGGLAQLGEHLLCKQGVVGSIPSSSTTAFACKSKGAARESTVKGAKALVGWVVGLTKRVLGQFKAKALLVKSTDLMV